MSSEIFNWMFFFLFLSLSGRQLFLSVGKTATQSPGQICAVLSAGKSSEAAAAAAELLIEFPPAIGNYRESMVLHKK